MKKNQKNSQTSSSTERRQERDTDVKRQQKEFPASKERSGRRSDEIEAPSSSRRREDQSAE